MTGRGKIQSLTNEWYGFAVFSGLVNLLLAVLGSGLFSFFTVPVVVVVAIVNLAITWAIGRLLIRRSSLTRIVLLILLPITTLLGVAGIYQFVIGGWTLSGILTHLVLACGLWMNLRSFLTLIDKDVRAYFR